MADNHTKEQRRKNMQHIRNKSSIEEIVRKYLFAKGLRYRKNVNTLPGKPDIVFPKYRTVVFVNGCFWHHHNCERFKWPKTHTDYWVPKIKKNEERDRRNYVALSELGWRVLVIWECELKKECREANLEKLYRKIINS
jgi:DNA mismatch endonuclease (patch repair protein)